MSMNLDQLSSSLASGTITRRRALAAIGAGALGALIPWGSRAQAVPECRQEGHPCEGNQKCCEGLKCVPAAGPGEAARCVKEDNNNKTCPKNAKKCEKDKDCDTKKGFTCSCKETRYVKKEECHPKKPKCDKGCECKKDPKTKKHFCVCKVEKKFCVKEKKH